MTENREWETGNPAAFDVDCPCSGKNLDKLLQPTILLVLSKGPLYGIDIVYGVSYSPLCKGVLPDPTGVYRYLKKMELAGLLTSHWEEQERGNRPKRLYALTPQGEACRSSWGTVLREYTAAIGQLTDDLARVETAN